MGTIKRFGLFKNDLLAIVVYLAQGKREDSAAKIRESLDGKLPLIVYFDEYTDDIKTCYRLIEQAVNELGLKLDVFLFYLLVPERWYLAELKQT